MILVLLGTNPYPFPRLLNAMGEYARMNNVIVIAQTGNTQCCEYVQCHPYVSHDQVMRWIAEADVVVCQGGYGSLSDCISQGARTVAVPRSVLMNECVDDQNELVNAFAEEGLVVPVYEIETLPHAIDIARSRKQSLPLPSALPFHIARTIRTLILGASI